MAQQIQLRHGTAAAWTSANPTLAAGEAGVETDTGRFKLGDGATAWASLAYAVDHTWYAFTVSGGAATIDWSVSDRWYGTLASGANTLTYANVPPAGTGRVLLLRLTQPASGAAGTVTWPANSLAPGGTAPALSAANGAVDDVNVSLTPDGKFDTFLAGAGLAAIA